MKIVFSFHSKTKTRLLVVSNFIVEVLWISYLSCIFFILLYKQWQFLSENNHNLNESNYCVLSDLFLHTIEKNYLFRIGVKRIIYQFVKNYLKLFFLEMRYRDSALSVDKLTTWAWSGCTSGTQHRRCQRSLRKQNWIHSNFKTLLDQSVSGKIKSHRLLCPMLHISNKDIVTLFYTRAGSTNKVCKSQCSIPCTQNGTDFLNLIQHLKMNQAAKLRTAWNKFQPVQQKYVGTLLYSPKIISIHGWLSYVIHFLLPFAVGQDGDAHTHIR